MATPEEIEDLKAQWVSDGCWDIEDTEGFEEHREELRAFAKEHQAKLDRIHEEKMTQRAIDFGCPGNLKLADTIDRLIARVADLEDKLKEVTQ